MLDYSGKVVVPKSFEEFEDYAAFYDRRLYYRIRRAVDFFMSELNLKVSTVDEGRVFWLLFADFVCKAMFWVNFVHGRDVLYEMTFGSKRKGWPDKADPKWKMVKEKEKKWASDFKEYWNSINPSTEELASRFEDYVRRRGGEGRFPLDVNRVLGGAVTGFLSRPSSVDIAYLVGLLASSRTKPLVDILKERQGKKRKKIAKKVVRQIL
jgi:hypothetical protein